MFILQSLEENKLSNEIGTAKMQTDKKFENFQSFLWKDRGERGPLEGSSLRGEDMSEKKEILRQLKEGTFVSLDPSVTHLSLKGAKLGSEALHLLCESLKKNTTLCDLDLAGIINNHSCLSYREWTWGYRSSTGLRNVKREQEHPLHISTEWDLSFFSSFFWLQKHRKQYPSFWDSISCRDVEEQYKPDKVGSVL